MVSRKEVLCQIKSLNNRILSEINNPKIKREHLLGTVNVLQSKIYINSNIDDILWFIENGLGSCNNVLDFGCGNGYLSYMLSFFIPNVSGCEYMGKWDVSGIDPHDYIDISGFIHGLIKQAKKIDFRYYTKFPLDYEDEYFDGIVLYAVIEHIDRNIIDSMFRELYRILKPSGCLYIAKLPRQFSYQEFLAKRLNLLAHSALYSKEDIVNLLNKHSFRVTNLSRTGLFFNFPTKITNVFHPFARLSEAILRFSPLSLLSHDFRLVAQKF